MANAKTLTIFNQLPGNSLLFIVTSDNWNCCDAPLPQQIYGGVDYNKTLDIPYLRKDGHGCNGRQGQFTLNVYANSVLIGAQAFDFDSDGGIELSAAPSGFRSSITGTDAGANYFVLPA